jgi:hypothetical protein
MAALTKHPRNQRLLPASSDGAVVEMVRNLKRGTNVARNSSFISYLPWQLCCPRCACPGARRSPQQEHRRRSRHQPAHGRQPSRGHHEEDRLEVSCGPARHGDRCGLSNQTRLRRQLRLSPRMICYQLPSSLRFPSGRSGRYGMTPCPLLASTIILSVPLMIRSMVSRYMRLRVTSGAFLYSS